LQEEEQYRRYFKEALELEILEQGYPADKAVLYEILELLVETVTSRKKFLRICGEEKPKEVVKKPPDEAGFLAYPVHIGVP